MGEFSIWHWLIVLAIVAMVFGTKKLKNIGADLGQAVKGFKDGMREAELGATGANEPSSAPPQNSAPQPILVHEHDGVQMAASDTAPHTGLSR